MERHSEQYINKTVQIYGEVRLYDRNLKMELENLESAFSLIQKLRALQINLEEIEGIKRKPTGTNDKRMSFATKFKLEKEINEMKIKYEPIIYVLDIKHQPVAREIIVENLFRRQLQKNPVRLRR